MFRKYIVLFALFMALPYGVAAQCGQRDVSGRWNVLIGSFKTAVELTLSQSGTGAISGTARDLGSVDFGFESKVEVKGQMTGDKVVFTIERNKSTKINVAQSTEGFEGVIGPDGTITGKANIFAIDGNIGVDFVSSRPMKCLFQKVGKLGVKHTAPATAVEPYITAAPNNIVLPFGQTAGQTTLIWDAGKDHPYAEVWFAVDGQSEQKILEKGAGSLPYPIAVGHSYVFILTDAGTKLATVTVQFRR